MRHGVQRDADQSCRPGDRRVPVGVDDLLEVCLVQRVQVGQLGLDDGAKMLHQQVRVADPNLPSLGAGMTEPHLPVAEVQVELSGESLRRPDRLLPGEAGELLVDLPGRVPEQPGDRVVVMRVRVEHLPGQGGAQRLRLLERAARDVLENLEAAHGGHLFFRGRGRRLRSVGEQRADVLLQRRRRPSEEAGERAVGVGQQPLGDVRVQCRDEACGALVETEALQ